MDKNNIFTAELILIFSLVIDVSRYFHCRVWITSDVSIHLTSLNVPHFRNSSAYNFVIYERKHKVWVFIFLVRTLGTMWYQNYMCFQFFFFFFFFAHFHRLLCEKENARVLYKIKRKFTFYW